MVYADRTWDNASRLSGSPSWLHTAVMFGLPDWGSMGGKVLVIDDVEAIRDAVCLLLKMEGLDAVAAAGAIEGVAQALRWRPSVVVLDQEMPEYDGGRTALILRALVPEARIVAFSAVLDARPTWADGYLPKEEIFRLPELVDVMSKPA